MQDYYKILGVQKDSSQEDIKKAYRKLAKKYHPDISKEKEADKKFKEITNAYEILSDPQKKQRYDTYGEEGFNQSQGFGDFDFEDILSSIFGGRTRNQHNQHRESHRYNIHFNIEVDLENIFFGKPITVNYQRTIFCPKCKGINKEEDKIKCPSCQGRGKTLEKRGFITVSTTCQECRGKGFSYKNPCKKCNSEGRIRKNESLKINIPKGCEEGKLLKASEKGHEYEHGKFSDLLVNVFTKKHPLFIRVNHSDLAISVPVPAHYAITEQEIEVPSFHGKVKVKIKKGLQNKSKLVCKGQGLPKVKTKEFGDLFVICNFENPKNLSDKELIDKLKEIKITKDNFPEYTKFGNIKV